MDIIYFFSDHPNLFICIIGFLGLFWGSFLNVVIYRLPIMMEYAWNQECLAYLEMPTDTKTQKLNLYLPLSHCPQCRKLIRPWHNIPVFSFLWLKGKCAYCKANIPLRYPLVELLTALLSMLTAYQFGITWQTLAALALTWICICLAFIDIDYHLLPDQLTLLLLWLGLFFSLFNIFPASHDAIIGAIAGYSIFAFIQSIFGWYTGKIGMGQGDYKFLAALGAFLGWQNLALIILLSSFSGIIYAVITMCVKRQFKSVPFPYGPHLAIAGWIALLWGNQLMQYYNTML